MTNIIEWTIITLIAVSSGTIVGLAAATPRALVGPAVHCEQQTVARDSVAFNNAFDGRSAEPWTSIRLLDAETGTVCWTAER